MKRLVIDLSSVIWTSLYAGKDTESGISVEYNGRAVLVNSAGFGRENALNMIHGAWKRFDIVPMNTITVFEGRNTKALRIAKLAGYKGGKDAGESHPAEAYEEFNKLKAMLLEDLRTLGAHACTQDGVEGDDVVAYLCENLEGEVRVLTGDGDLTILTNERVKIWRQGSIAENPYGPFPFQYITLYKALVGDTSDKIPGATRFGKKAWLDLYCLFGDEGLEALDGLVRARNIKSLAEDVSELKALQCVIDSEAQVYQSYDAALLYPQFVNTLRNPLQWTAGFTSNNYTVHHDERLKGYAAAAPRLINTDTYDRAMGFLEEVLKVSPFVALDIETATSEESDEWLMRLKGLDADDDLGVDVFGSELVGLGLTFGPNMQYSFYFTTEHLPDADRNRNLTPLQILDAVRLIPKGTEIVVHNSGFELPVLYMTWGEADKDNGFHGFLPNVVDTMIMASEVNENISKGLKQSSKHYFDYDQVTFEEVTKGRKMHMIPAEEVLLYGCDDTIMTAGLFNFFTIMMEIEKTMAAYREVEIKPAYVLAKSFVDGCKFSMESMKAMERDDQEAYEASWAVMRDYLIANGAEGTVCPTFTAEDLTVPAKIKEIYTLCTGNVLQTQVRTPEKLFKLIASSTDDEWEGTTSGGILACLMEKGDVEQINAWAKREFSGEPVMDFDSPKVMRRLLYETFALPVRLVNKVTDTERGAGKLAEIKRKQLPGADDELLHPDFARIAKEIEKLEKTAARAKAVSKFNAIRAGRDSDPLTQAENLLLLDKAKTDSKAVGFALLYEDGTPEIRALLGHIQTIKTMETRRKLFYAKYVNSPHWKDGLLHPSANQVGTVTRRPSCTAPNLNQLPKKGEGVKFRENFIPHCEDGVIVSIDQNSQELRLSGDLSRDPNLLACYIGDDRKDVHSLTASTAMRRKWGVQFVEDAFPTFGIDAALPNADYLLFLKMRTPGSIFYKKADDLRKGSKNVNFASHYDAMAPKISETLVIPIEDAEVFIAAKEAMFPRFGAWKDEVKARVRRTGYAVTYKGARRHLAAGVLSEDKWEQEAAMRQGPNFEIQGSAAEQTKLAIGHLWDSGALFTYNARFIANIYDELVCSVSIKDALPFIKVLHEGMAQPYMDIVPSVGSISLGPTFGEQIECGDEYDEEIIKQALAKVRESRQMPIAA